MCGIHENRCFKASLSPPSLPLPFSEPPCSRLTTSCKRKKAGAQTRILNLQTENQIDSNALPRTCAGMKRWVSPRPLPHPLVRPKAADLLVPDQAAARHSHAATQASVGSSTDEWGPDPLAPARGSQRQSSRRGGGRGRVRRWEDAAAAARRERCCQIGFGLRRGA